MAVRRVEITAFEQERVIRRSVTTRCPVCHRHSELLTTAQAAALVQVKRPTVCRWLARGRAHGIRTPGGHHRVCLHSLLCVTDSSSQNHHLQRGT